MNWKKVVRKGKPHQEILMAAREGKHDLIVMGSFGEQDFPESSWGASRRKCSAIRPAQSSRSIPNTRSG